PPMGEGGMTAFQFVHFAGIGIRQAAREGEARRRQAMNLRRLSIFLAAILLVAAWSTLQNKTAQSAAPKVCGQLCLIQEASPACRKAIQALQNTSIVGLMVMVGSASGLIGS